MNAGDDYAAARMPLCGPSFGSALWHATIYKALLWKRYFEIGTALTSPLKGLLLLFGVTSRDVGLTLQFAVVYALVTLLAGWWWHASGNMRREFEIMNTFNPMAEDVRKLVK